MQQKVLGLSCGLGGWGGQPVTWKWLLTLWSKGQRLASSARGHAGSHALLCWRLTEAAEQSKKKPHVVTFWRMSLSMSSPLATGFRSARLVQTKGQPVIVYFCPSFLIVHFVFPSPSCSFWSYCTTGDILGGGGAHWSLNGGSFWETMIRGKNPVHEDLVQICRQLQSWDSNILHSCTFSKRWIWLFVYSNIRYSKMPNF